MTLPGDDPALDDQIERALAEVVIAFGLTPAGAIRYRASLYALADSLPAEPEHTANA